MKKIFALLAVAMLGLFSCKKSTVSSANNPGGGNNGNGGGGNNTGSLTYISISPANPYPNDEFTITGTGFNPDAAQDTVEFGHLIGGGFAAWHDGLPDEYASLTTITKASATQLTIKVNNPFSLDYAAFESTPFAPDTSIAVMQIRTGGKKVVSPAIPFKRYIALTGIQDLQSNVEAGRPNDSIEIDGQGFDAGASFAINGTAIPTGQIVRTPYTNNYKVHFLLPKEYFGTENDETLTTTQTVTVTNPDGKSVEKTCSFYLSPKMILSDMHAEQSTYSVSGLANIGGVVKIDIAGACLKDDATLTLGNGAGFSTTVAVSVSGFPNQAIVEINPASLALGNYQVKLWRNNGLYGGCNFKLEQ
ncbi:MAG TPA: hypothetical protein VG890_02315 [Puia sp.]|nr:hypothetical protein [Puia sp.]